MNSPRNYERVIFDSCKVFIFYRCIDTGKKYFLVFWWIYFIKMFFFFFYNLFSINWNLIIGNLHQLFIFPELNYRKKKPWWVFQIFSSFFWNALFTFPWHHSSLWRCMKFQTTSNITCLGFICWVELNKWNSLLQKSLLCCKLLTYIYAFIQSY